MLTCQKCIFNQSSVDLQSKELQRVCTRFPPTMHLIPTNRGLVGNVSYPVINNEFTACGEYFDGEESDEIDTSQIEH